jgi:hypothetical protein
MNIEIFYNDYRVMTVSNIAKYSIGFIFFLYAIVAKNNSILAVNQKWIKIPNRHVIQSKPFESPAIREIGKSLVISSYMDKFKLHNITFDPHKNRAKINYEILFADCDVSKLNRNEDILLEQIIVSLGGLVAENIHSMEKIKRYSYDNSYLFNMAYYIVESHKEKIPILANMLLNDLIVSGEIVDFYVREKENYKDQSF